MERTLAPLAGDLTESAAFEAFVGFGVGVADHVVVPAGESREHAGLRPRGLVLEPGDDLGVAELFHAGLDADSEIIHPARQLKECAERAEAHVHPHQDRHSEGHDLGTGFGGPLAGLELVLVGLGPSRVDSEDVPVDRPIRGDRHLGHQLDFVVVEPVEAAVGDPLECGALVQRGLLAKFENLVPCGPSAQATG